MKILVLKFGALGDVVRTSYILPYLYEKYNKPVIDWITKENAFELLRYNPFIRILETNKHDLGFLEGNEYDLVLSYDDEDEVLNLLNNISGKRIIGAFLSNGKKCYEDSSAEWFDMGLISKYGKEIADKKKKENNREHNQIFGTMLGIHIKEPVFYNSSIIESKINQEFDKSYFNVGINPSAGKRWESKSLPISESVQLIKALSEMEIEKKKVRIHLLGGKSEQERNATIQTESAVQNLVNWGGNNTLLEFAAIIKNCNYMISSDSLALHFAISQKVMNLSFYAPTSADEIGTFGTGRKIRSLAEDYCNYKANANNSTITAERLIGELKSHLNIISS